MNNYEKWLWFTLFIIISIGLFLLYVHAEPQQYTYTQTQEGNVIHHKYDIMCNTKNIVIKDIRVGNIEIPCKDYPNQVVQFNYDSIIIGESKS